MIPERAPAPARIIRRGWSEAGGSRAATAAAAASDEPAPGATRPRSPGPRRLAAVLTALALLAVATPWLLLHGQDSEEVVRTYLDALIAGDLGIVRDHLVPVDGAVPAALTEPLRDATPGGITGYTIDAVVVRGSGATVQVTVHNRREQHTVVLPLTAVLEGPLRARHWELHPVPLPLLVLGPRASTGVVLLNGRRVEIPAVHWTGRRTDRPGVALHVLPGRYTVELPPAAPPLLPRTSEVYVPPVLGRWQSGLISVDYRLTREGAADARSAILDALAQCLRSTMARPPDCPVGADLPADTLGRWHLVQSPEISYGAMMGDTFDFRGRDLVAEFIESPAVPALTGPEDGSTLVRAPRVHRVTVDFGATLRQDRTGFTLESWLYNTQRPWLPGA